MSTLSSFWVFFRPFLGESARLYVAPIDERRFPARKPLAILLFFVCAPLYVLDGWIGGQPLSVSVLNMGVVAALWGISLAAQPKSEWLSASAGMFLVALLAIVPIDALSALAASQQSPALGALRTMSILLQIWFCITFARLTWRMLRKTD